MGSGFRRDDKLGGGVRTPDGRMGRAAALARRRIENPTACANIGARGIILATLLEGGSMALGSQPRWTVRPAAGVQVDIDVGLRDYMLRIYNYMASGLALTGIVAYVFAQSGLYQQLAQTPLIWLVMLAPLGLVMWLSYGINRMQAATAQAIFWAYAALMGVALASVF